MKSIMVLLYLSGGSIVLLFCLYSAHLLYHVVSDDSESAQQRTPWTASDDGSDGDTGPTEHQSRRQRPRRSREIDDIDERQWQWGDRRHARQNRRRHD